MPVSGPYAAQLRAELLARNRIWARDCAHVESYGTNPTVLYAPEGGAHDNFHPASYAAIAAAPAWQRRFDKIHAQVRSLPKAERRWRELDSCISSDALLMNIFCHPQVCASPRVRTMLGVETDASPEFGVRARVPLASGRTDRTEVDMRWGSLLVEAKLTESDFQSCRTEVAEAYRDFDVVFDRDLLPRAEIPIARRRESAEFPEEYTQEEVRVPAETWEPTRIEKPRPSVAGYAGYQLIRNVLAAHALGSSFCVMHDERRPDLREQWFAVMAAVRPVELRVRLKVLTWQELAAALPTDLQDFLDHKYGIVPCGRCASPIQGILAPQSF
ncbi:MAG TPA: hypothetical protein VG893_16135 [Terracidiphilus sp.]|nr:hypothetical protein [Terracidiphilus sp.]